MELTIEALQRPCLLGMARIIRKVLDIKWSEKKATTPKTTGWCPLNWHILYQEITSDLVVKEIIILLFPNVPVLGFRNGESLKDCLVRYVNGVEKNLFGLWLYRYCYAREHLKFRVAP